MANQPLLHVHTYDELGRMTCCILEESIEQFTFSEHLHRFACWTAARAVQRGFSAKTEDIQKAIDETELRTLVESRSLGHHESYDAFHVKTCEIIQQNLKTTFGRAAKIVAIYLKTSVVMPDKGESDLAKEIYPPIDRKLLTNLHKKFRKDGFNKVWTGLNKNDHQFLIKKMKKISPNSFWKIEFLWP